MPYLTPPLSASDTDTNSNKNSHGQFGNQKAEIVIMKEVKKSFLMHHDACDALLEMSDEDTASLIREIIRYSKYIANPTKAKKPSGLTGLLSVVFISYKNQLDRELESWEKKRTANINNGKLGGRPKSKNPKNPSKPVKVKDNVKDNDILFNNGESPLPKSFKNWSNDEFQRTIETAVESNPEFMTIKNAFFDYWTEPDPTGRPKFSKEKTWYTKGRLKRWLDRQPAPNITGEDKIKKMMKERERNF